MPTSRDGLVRLYVVTDGRAYPTHDHFDLVSLVVVTPGQSVTGLSREKRCVIALCRGGLLSVVELAAHLNLPVSVTKVLLADLVDSGHIATRAPAAPAQGPSLQLLQEVLDGLRALT